MESGQRNRLGGSPCKNARSGEFLSHSRTPRARSGCAKSSASPSYDYLLFGVCSLYEGMSARVLLCVELVYRPFGHVRRNLKIRRITGLLLCVRSTPTPTLIGNEKRGTGCCSDRCSCASPLGERVVSRNAPCSARRSFPRSACLFHLGRCRSGKHGAETGFLARATAPGTDVVRRRAHRN